MAKIASRNYYHNDRRKIKTRLLRQTDVCAICGKKFVDMKEVTIDHIVPLSKGGPDIHQNMQLAHRSCNQEKGNLIE
jgi:5-methylcytosine-specific restriction endonuclease McrA